MLCPELLEEYYSHQLKQVCHSEVECDSIVAYYVEQGLQPRIHQLNSNSWQVLLSV